MKKLIEIEINGDTESDLELALETVMAQISEGHREGFNENETGSYSFTVKED